MCTCHGFFFFFKSFFSFNFPPSILFYHRHSSGENFAFRLILGILGLYIVFVWIRIKYSCLERNTALLAVRRGRGEMATVCQYQHLLISPVIIHTLCLANTQKSFSQNFFLIAQMHLPAGLHDTKWLIIRKVICVSELVTTVFIWVFPQASKQAALRRREKWMTSRCTNLWDFLTFDFQLSF